MLSEYTVHLTPTSLQVRPAPAPKPRQLPPRPQRNPDTNYQINVSKVKKRLWLFFLLRNCTPGIWFWTVTFPSGFEDELCYKCFNSWLTNCRKRYGLKSYLWVAERQKNNTIHFHIFIGERMRVQSVNKAMKEAINKYVDCPRYNGIHISKDNKGRAINLRSVKNKRKTIINYVTKYVTKSAVINSNQKRNENLMWHCSRSIAQLKTSYKLPDYHKRNALAWANSKLPSQNYVINTDFCLIIPLCDIPDMAQKWFWNYLEMQEINFLNKYDPGELKNRYSSQANINIYAVAV